MAESKTASTSLDSERIDVHHDDAMCAWARHFNTSEQQVKKAVQAVGDRADSVREQLIRKDGSDHPGAR